MFNLGKPEILKIIFVFFDIKEDNKIGRDVIKWAIKKSG